MKKCATPLCLRPVCVYKDTHCSKCYKSHMNELRMARIMRMKSHINTAVGKDVKTFQ